MMADGRGHEDKSSDGQSTNGDSGDSDASPLHFLKPRPVPTSLPIVLGSSSPFRRAVLEQLGWKFTTASPDIDEKAIRDPDPRRMCAMIARAKAEALMEHLDNHSVLITVDQVCLFDGDDGEEVREKPVSVEQARAFLESYSGRSVKTLSAVCVTNLEAGGRRMEGTHESTVVWKDIPAEVVDTVISKGTTMGSAGGFAIEDPDLKQLVKRIDGSTDSVLGLPVDLLCGLIEDATQNIGNA